MVGYEELVKMADADFTALMSVTDPPVKVED